MGARARRIREPASGSARRALAHPRQRRLQLGPGGLLRLGVAVGGCGPGRLEVLPPGRLAGDREVPEQCLVVAWHRVSPPTFHTPPGGEWFPRHMQSLQSRAGPLAQLVEQGTFNPKVAGSIPARPTGHSAPADRPTKSRSHPVWATPVRGLGPRVDGY